MKMQIRGARLLHICSAFWMLALAFLIFADVFGRLVFSSPVPGTKELLQNSVVTITFVQIPLAIYSGSMLRTTILSDAVPPVMRRLAGPPPPRRVARCRPPRGGRRPGRWDPGPTPRPTRRSPSRSSTLSTCTSGRPTRLAPAGWRRSMPGSTG